ncbi:hypothetical protein DdX_02162 [Ditylenchus destructor]|uniref:Uncharacterized protein n=1 Tax=Ditylenchus destructor TaxID=166010 RepID=A0AAD4NDT4_9BILA|nr:hypothetical protein DdX_02162 [Ditylenchus destructor]
MSAEGKVTPRFIVIQKTDDAPAQEDGLSSPRSPNATERHRSNSCIGIPDEAISSGAKDRKSNQGVLKNSNLLSVHNHRIGGSSTSIHKDPVVESSLALRKLSQAFGLYF